MSLGRPYARASRASRSLISLAAGAVLLGTVGTSPSVGVIQAAPRTLRLHTGPLGYVVSAGSDLLVKLMATNPTGTAREATMTLFDQNGRRIEQDQLSIAPGDTGIVEAVLVPAVQAVRGRLITTDGGIWRLSLTVEGGAGDDVLAFTDEAVSQSRLPERASTTAYHGGACESLQCIVRVTNLSSQVRSYGVRLVDADGEVVESGRIEGVRPGSIGTIAIEAPGGGRIVVTGRDGSRFLTTTEVQGVTIDGYTQGD